MARLFLLLVLQCLWSLGNSFDVAKRAYHIARTISTSPLPPSQDPFYTAPPNFAAAAPGTILRSRQAADVTQFLPNCSGAYNILYRTTDSRYQPSFAVTTLFLPLSSQNGTNSTNSTYSPGSSLLSYQIPYDSANVDLSPSFTVYGGALNTFGVPALLGQGWYVNVPDYEGPNASFSAGVQSGHATLDSVRAALNAGHGLAANASYAMAGYSGGALATEWAAELQVQYAPELEFAGVALGGLTPNATSTIQSLNNSPASELMVNAILGLMSQFPDLKAFVLSQLNPSGEFNASTFLNTTTAPPSFDNIFSGQNIGDYFKNGLATFTNPLVKRIVNNDGIMGFHGVPQMPLFVYKATHDEISVVGDTDVLVDRYCGIGADILYQRNSIGGHAAEFLNGFGTQLEWLTAAFAGNLPQVFNGTSGPGLGCTIQDVEVSISTSPS